MIARRRYELALALWLASWCAGCSRASRGSPPVTFADHVAPILREHCVTCHHPGGAGPFSLVGYEDVRKHARQIVKATARRYMPPWPPERGEITFVGERGLTAAQIDVFRRWLDGGLQAGNRAALPPPPTFPEGWQLGQPDAVLTMAHAYLLAADGDDVFRNFVFAASAIGRRYVRAIEILAGNQRVVHHANVIVDRSGASRRRDAADAEVGFEGMDVEIASNQFDPDSHFLFWKPGAPPTLEPDDMAWTIDGKTDLVLNMHLRPSGKPETIQPTIGLHFTDRAPSRFPMLLQLEHDGAIDIPAGAHDFEITDSYRLPVDVDLLALYPHAHYLGHDLLGNVTLPDGTTKTLIHIPDWDLGWQSVYRLTSPLTLRRGSVISMRFRYDNTAGNPRNPNEPPRRVVAGNRSADEMGHLWIQVAPKRREDLSLLQEALMRRRLEKYPGDFVAHENLGATLQSMARLDEAIVHLQAAAAARPTDAMAVNNLGAALLEAGKPSEALELFRRAVRLAPTFADARYNLASVLLRLGDMRGGIEQLQRLLELTPDDAAALNDLGSALAMQGQLGRAETLFGRAIRIEPEHALAHYNLAGVLARRGRLGEAVEHYQIAKRLRPDDREIARELETMRSALAASGSSKR